MKLKTSAPLLLLPALWVASCTSPVDEAGSTLPGKCQSDAPVVAPQKTDILFVIDNSGSMAEEQAGIATELPGFIKTLREGGGVTQDFRVGVITTSVYQRIIFQGRDVVRDYPGEAGHLQPVPDADGKPTVDRYLESSDEGLLERFQRLVKQGTSGSGQEAPFEAVRLALSEPLTGTPILDGGNGGFLRDDARLLVVVVTDEEDCSSDVRPPPVILSQDTSVDKCSEGAALLKSVDSYFEFFRGLRDSKGARREVLWATVGPVALSDKRAELIQDRTPQGTFVRNADCPTSYGPGYRHRAMAEKFDTHFENLDSICRESYRDTLLRIAELAAVSQSVDVVNLPDPRLAQVELTRAGGEVERCSVAAGDLSYEPSGEGRSARIYFGGDCLRRADDKKVEVKVICAG
ncbi:VWA domain-containing protein [Myxococcus landrumensis]|uniref:VWA domain-containing protein n=1 Tax=Myxococcus landrumensis TaxID=2813577 RepID=A0ABX7NDX8_9BACT|nr:VWA domain-containing protein [Myxococcus landrumus]QSQ15802.1 VWA domain-containing protein [Myxococcus landrumus]